MTEFEPWDRVRHTYTAYTGQKFVREGNITTITPDFGIAYTTGTATFLAQPENLELISKRTRKRVGPTKQEKVMRAKLKALEKKLQYLKVRADPYEYDEWERGYNFGQRQMARELLEIITEGKR
jgi:hypothetical protein